jgi:hypothetical protein
MTTSLRSTKKATCIKCKRAVYVVIIDGARAFADAEMITVITLDAKPTKIQARRSHNEVCGLYVARSAALAKVKSERG